MRKFLRVGSFTLHVLSATQLTWLPVAGGPVCLKVPKRPATDALTPVPWPATIPFSVEKLSLKSHGGGLIWVNVFTLAGAIPVDCAQTMLPGTLDVPRIRTAQVKIATKALIGAFFILVTTTLSLLGLRPRGGYGPQNEKVMNHEA